MTPQDVRDLDHANERLRLTLAAAGASGTWDWDIEHGRFHPDARFAMLYGLDPAGDADGFPPSAFFSAIHPDDRARVRIAVAGILGGAEVFSKEYRIVGRDGAVKWVHGRGRSHLDVDDRPVRFTGLLVDITEQKRTEDRLRIAQTAGGIGTFEYVGGFGTATVSPQFCRLLGLHPADVLPVSTINEVVLPGEQPIIPARVGESAEVLDDEIRIVRAEDGEERWIARRGEIVGDAETAGHRFLGALYDVTSLKQAEERLRVLNETLESRVQQEIAEREQAEEALRQAQKMEAIGQLTGGIAHDFNNLLTIIIGNIDTLGRRLGSVSDPRTVRALENALKGAERAAALTQRLLAFSRRQPLNPKAVDIELLLSGVTDLLRRSLGESVLIETKVTPGVWTVEVDQNQLENALLNLAVNARDAMAGTGLLTIAARNVEAGGKSDAPARPHVMIAVSDTGSGMPPETVARAFDPFFTTKEVGKGTGLGLSMVYGFVKQSGGNIEIDSIVGQGTTIRLYLPRVLAKPEEQVSSPDSRTETGSLAESILVVEDDDDVRAYTVESLRELGYRVIEAHDGPSALRLLERQEQPVNLLLTDVVMPAMSGRELAETAREIQPGIKILFSSGYTRDAISHDGRLDPGIELLSKPFTYQALATKVRSLLDEREA